MENPYQAPLEDLSALKPIVPHTASVRWEAWRGFKFGAKLMFAAMAILTALFLIAGVGVFIRMVILTDGAVLEQVNFFKIGMVVLMSLYVILVPSLVGGFAGSLIMALNAVVKKLRR